MLREVKAAVVVAVGFVVLFLVAVLPSTLPARLGTHPHLPALRVNGETAPQSAAQPEVPAREGSSEEPQASMGPPAHGTGANLSTCDDFALPRWPTAGAHSDAEEFRYGERTHKLLHERQHPPDCRAARYVVAERYGGSGFGSRVWFYRMCLTKAYVMNRVYLQLWTGPKDFHHLEPWTNCTKYDVEAAAQVHGKDTVVKCQWPDDVPLWYNLLPPEFANFGLLWWQTQLVRYLLRPDPQLMETLQSNLQTIPRPFAGIHLRYHPLKKAESGRRKPFKLYLKMVPANVTNIFIAADKNVTAHTSKFPEYTYYYKQHFSKGTDHLLDILLLAQADRLVFTYSSCFGQMAMHLQLARDFCRAVSCVDNFFHAVGTSYYVFREDELRTLPLRFAKGGNVTLCRSVLSKYNDTERGLAVWRDHVSALQPTRSSMHQFLMSYAWPLHLPKRALLMENCATPRWNDTATA